MRGRVKDEIFSEREEASCNVVEHQAMLRAHLKFKVNLDKMHLQNDLLYFPPSVYRYP